MILNAQVPTLTWFSNALFLGAISDVIALVLLTNGFTTEVIRSLMGYRVVVMKPERVVDRQILYLL